jgi:hypothetical protein
MASSSLAGHLISHAQQRFDRFATTSIDDLFSSSNVFLEVPETFLDFLSEHRQSLCGLIKRWLLEVDFCPREHKLIKFLTYNTRRFLKNNNQFLVLTETNHNDLAEVYRQFLVSFYSALKSGGSFSLANNVIDTLKYHRENLRGFVKPLLTPQSAIGYSNSPSCSEYSPSLQIKVLHLNEREVTSPVLDIGCGEQANLVRHLRLLKKHAFGIDKFAQTDEPYLWREDWLTYPLGCDRWGTILSHIAFSNHFLHHYLKGSPAIGDYARRYMEILESLQPNGCFIYSPGLPFIEELLPPDKFDVEVLPIPEVRGTTFDKKIELLVGKSTFYSACVRRIE